MTTKEPVRGFQELSWDIQKTLESEFRASPSALMRGLDAFSSFAAEREERARRRGWRWGFGVGVSLGIALTTLAVKWGAS